MSKHVIPTRINVPAGIKSQSRVVDTIAFMYYALLITVYRLRHAVSKPQATHAYVRLAEFAENR